MPVASIAGRQQTKTEDRATAGKQAGMDDAGDHIYINKNIYTYVEKGTPPPSKKNYPCPHVAPGS